MVISRGNKINPKVVFITNMPSYGDNRIGYLFSGKVGELYEQVLSYVGLTPYLCLVTSVLRSFTGEPSKEAVLAGMERLQQEIAEWKPDLVVAFGVEAAKAIFTGCTSIQKFRGNFHDSVFGIPGLATYSPAMALIPHHDTKLQFIINDLNRVRIKLHKEYKDYMSKDIQTRIIRTEEDIKWLEKSIDTDCVAFDWETTGLNPRTNKGICLGLAWSNNCGATIPLDMLLEHYDVITSLLNVPFTSYCAFNSMFDIAWNKLYGLPERVDYDPMLMHHMLYETPQQRSLEVLSMEFCDADPYESNMIAQYNCPDKSQMTEYIPMDVIYNYCAYDCVYTYRLTQLFRAEIKNRPKLIKLNDNLLVPASHMLSEVQHNGFWIDQTKLETVKEDLEQNIISCTAELKGLTEKDEFNPNSHPQVQSFVWDTLKLMEPKIHKRQDRSVDKETREKLLEKYPDNLFIRKLHEYKDLYTLYSRYVRPIPELIEDDGRVRCSIHMDRTETGRLSTTKPALHQIPKESTVRSMYSSPEGYTLVQADSKQIEMRMAAHIAKDSNLTRIINSGEDFHTKMASEAFGIPVAKVTPQQRQAAKPVSFGLLYLMSDEGLAAQTGLSKKEAMAFIQNYKKLMPDVFRWVEDIKHRIKEDGFVESVFGRRRRFLLVTQENIDGLHREAVNMPIQSSSSDLTLWQATVLHDIFKEHPEWDARILLLVHDSIITECKEEYQDKVAEAVKFCMETIPFDTEVKFEAEVKINKCWL